MTLTNLKSCILRAQRECWAVGAFNANTLEQVQAIVQAGQEEAAPVMIQISYNALRYAGQGNPTLGMRYLVSIAQTAAMHIDVPVALHLDHAPEEAVLRAMRLGFTSVMFDSGELPYAENVAATRRLREAANLLDISLEAELGEVPRAASGAYQGEFALTDPEQAARFVAETGIDALAVSIGSVHAIESKTIRLDLDRLQAIRAQVAVPLVLHGSSGVTDEQVLLGIQAGLCKINVATQLNQAFTQAVRETLEADPRLSDPRKYLEAGRAAMVAAVRERMRLFGAAGKAWEG